jgi:hypothetical protein
LCGGKSGFPGAAWSSAFDDPIDRAGVIDDEEVSIVVFGE